MPDVKKLEAGTLAVLALLAGLAWTFLAFDREPAVANFGNDGEIIVAFGDSLVEGIGARENGGFVTMLSRDLDVGIENLGRSGETTKSGLERLDDVLELNPKLVLLLLGGNDVLQRVPKEETFRNLDEIVERIQGAGSMVLVLGVRGGLLRDGYEADYRKLAERHDAVYVSNVLKGLIGNAEYMYDAIHPNEAGYRIIARRIYPVLKRLLE